MKHLKSNWMSNLKTQNEALADLILGILIFGILVVFAGLFVAPDKAAFVLGAVLGTATSVIRAVHMAVTLDRQLDYGEKDARAYAASQCFLFQPDWVFPAWRELSSDCFR